MDLKTRTDDIASLKSIIDAIPSAVQIIGPDGLFLDCNAATYTMLGASAVEDIIGKSPAIISSEKQSDGTDSRKGSKKYIDLAFSGETTTFEWEHKRLDGTIFPCLVTLQVIEYNGQNCLMSTLVDITDLVAFRQKSEFIIRNAPTPLMDILPDLSIAAANVAFADLIDTPMDKLSTMKLSDFDVRDRVGGSLTEALETKSQVTGVMDAVVSTGTKNLEYFYNPFYDNQGTLVSIIAYYIDKTAEKKAVREIITLTERCQAGYLDSRLDPEAYSGELRSLTEGINGTLDAIIGPLNVAAEYVDRISKGDIPPKITDEYNGDFNEIKNNLNTCIDSLTSLLSDTTKMYEEQKTGNIEALIDINRYNGFYKEIIAGYNDAVGIHISSVLKILSVLTAYSEGDFSPVLEKMPGKQALANERMDKLRENILALVQDCDTLIQASVEGKLNTRADITRHQGEYRKIVEGINNSLDAIIKPLRDAGAVLERMAVNDHTKGMDEAAYQGDFVTFASNINAVRERVNHIADSIVQISEGDLSELGTYQKIGRRSEQDRVVPGLIKAFGNLQALTNDTNLLVDAAAKGNFDIRADASRHEGEYRRIIEGINATVGTMADKVAWYESILDSMQFPITVTDLNAKWTFVNKAVEDMLKVSRKEIMGHPCKEWGAGICNTENCGIVRLRKGFTSTNFEQSGGHFKVDVAYVKNAKGENVGHVEVVTEITPLVKMQKEMENKAAWYESILDAIPFPVSVTDLNMNWTFLNPATAKMANVDKKAAIGTQCNRWNANICRTKDCGIECLRAGMRETFFEQDGGFYKVDVEYVKDASGKDIGHVEVIQDVTAVKKVEKYLDESVNNITYCLGQFAEGKTNFNVKIPTADQYTKDVQEKIAVLSDNLHHARDSVKNLVLQANNLAQAAIRGDLKYRADAAKVAGDFAEVVNGVNQTLETVGIPLNAAAKWIEDVANGRDVTDITEEYPGDYAVIKNNINESNRVLRDLIMETDRLSKGATAGDLKVRGDISRYNGAWKGIVVGINETLDTVVTPVQEAIRIAQEYAKANFTVRFDPAITVNGDWVGFKTALDDIGIQICGAIEVINKQILELASNAEEATASVQEVSAGAQQIAKNAGSVSANAEQGDDGVTQVLKAMEDLTITVGEVSQRAEMVSGSATQANQFSKEGIELAKKSESAMSGITSSTQEVDQIVKEINKQMEEIGKIVRLITDISNQTNLLALNAAIEAARAGEAGRGFAVVAAEVKSLAQDSRTSAENIADMIANLQAKASKANDAIITAGSAVEDGNHSLEKTVAAFTKIADSIEDITRNAMDMASSSEEQAASVEEITASVNEVSVLLQGTSREAGDAAAATEEASASIEQIGRVVTNVSGIADAISREMTKFKI